jgi:hypothetical protein
MDATTIILRRGLATGLTLSNSRDKPLSLVFLVVFLVGDVTSMVKERERKREKIPKVLCKGMLRR